MIRNFFNKNKKREKEEIQNFLNNYELYPLSNEYRESHKHQIDALRWLLHYYDGYTAVAPKERLEGEMKNLLLEIFENRKDTYNKRFIWIFVLYHWIHNKYIFGFSDNMLLDNFNVNLKNEGDYCKLVDYFNFVKPYIRIMK